MKKINLLIRISNKEFEEIVEKKTREFLKSMKATYGTTHEMY